MTNQITQAERGQIIARAKQLAAEHGDDHDLITALLVAEFNISLDRARRAASHAVLQARRPGAPAGNRNAARPEQLQRIVYHNARLPRWLCEWLDGQDDRGRLIEEALVEKHGLQAP